MHQDLRHGFYCALSLSLSLVKKDHRSNSEAARAPPGLPFSPAALPSSPLSGSKIARLLIGQRAGRTRVGVRGGGVRTLTPVLLRERESAAPCPPGKPLWGLAGQAKRERERETVTQQYRLAFSACRATPVVPNGVCVYVCVCVCVCVCGQVSTTRVRVCRHRPEEGTVAHCARTCTHSLAPSLLPPLLLLLAGGLTDWLTEPLCVHVCVCVCVWAALLFTHTGLAGRTHTHLMDTHSHSQVS